MGPNSFICQMIISDKNKLEQETCAQKESTPKIAYICDRRSCEKCSYPDCMHTFDISHAADFVKDGAGNFIEE